ncbi:hypothetical protein H9Q72_007999 [Fusarium xylarioides]|uniref:Knr4/Smi1-like domain-containing protein n=1 Tax=Fusarium xylarioides TaxID=221167 RepID=A0A9P7IMK2_9HYPO|nr:hypothetical protein H9Q72_007999 [Fusarium xylarioides]KAG5810143.1 hypothetical protein H9Q71_005676 [Fusarium xylarioides]KAG5824481.1 hypothetical protein H9Q74_005419 [Fusarium xylarioides]
MATSKPKDIEPEHLRFEFLLRHVDDKPSIADTRSRTEAIRRIIRTAVNFAVVGEIDGATRLLETLTSRGIDLFQYSDFDYPFLKPCMFFAWEATSSWPSWIPEEERTEEKLQELEVEGRRPWLERFSQEWEVTEGTAEKALDMAYNGLTTNLPDYNGTLAGQVVQAEAMAANGVFSYSASPNGPMAVRYMKIAMWWRQGIFPYPFVQLYRTAGLMIALDIYLRLGKEEKARELFVKVCDRFHTEEQVEQLVCSRAAWKQILAVPERPVLDFLNIHAAKLRPAVTRTCQMADSRLKDGPRRRYAGQSIEKLVHIISENTFKNCPYDRLDAYRPPDNLRNRPKNANGLLRRGCHVSGTQALEERLGVTLPEDYKELLRTTNGLDSIWDGQNLVDYLAGAQEVNWQEIDFLEGNELPLLNDGEPLAWTGNMLEWPKIEKPRCICLSGDINHEDRAGHLFLIGQDLLQPAKDYFFKTYVERNDTQRRELDRLVQETYGSMEKFENLEWGLISWTAWDFTVYPYNGIKDFLEQMAEASLRQERPWLNMFEPRYRRTANMDDV